MSKEMTNKAYAASIQFIAICEKAGVKPTKRQASKFRMSKGAAFKHHSCVV